MTPELQDFIAARRHLVWWVKDPRALNEEAVVEAVLNYGDWNDVQELNRLMGIKRVAAIFAQQAAQTRCNYHAKTKHYFGLYFAKHA